MDNTQLKIRVMNQLFNLLISNDKKRLQPEEIEKRAVEIINLNQEYLSDSKETAHDTE